jgi:hypothetical protein
MKQLLNSVKASLDITGIVVDVVLVTALIPVIAVFIAGATNLSATEKTILSLTTLFIVLALGFNIAKQSGLIKK